MNSIKKVAILRYITKKSKYLTQVDKMLIQEVEGENFEENLKKACKAQGYEFKTYNVSSNSYSNFGYDYEIIVN